MEKSKHRFINHNSFDKFPVESDSIDLVMTSPPYPMIEMWDSIYTAFDPVIGKLLDDNEGLKAFEKMHVLLDRTWQECQRVTKEGGFVCINIGDATRTLDGRFRLYNNHGRIIEAFDKMGFDVLPYIIWRKPTNSPTKFMGSGMLPAGAYVTLEHEHLLIFRKGRKRSFNKEESALRRKSAYFWEERNQWFCDQWEVLGTRQELHGSKLRNRSAAYPIEIPVRILLMYSQLGDTVLDPFSGIGTTAMAALTYGRNSISLEYDEALIDATLKSIKKRGMKEMFNELIQERLRKHQLFVDSKDELFFTYLNKSLQVPVKTTQEKELEIYPLQSIGRHDNSLSITYRKFKKTELMDIRNHSSN